MTALGIDVGGTKIAGAVVHDGEMLSTARVDTPTGDADALLAAINDVASELLASSVARDTDIGGVGIGAAGYVSSDRSRVVSAPNLPWRDVDAGAWLADRIGLPVVVENDANAAAWGEFTHGAAAPVQHSLMVTLGTGVGGGVISDGELLRGGAGFAGEIGHVRVVMGPDGRPCGCGRRGCLEQYASGTGLERTAAEQIVRGEWNGVDGFVVRWGRSPSGRDVTDAAEGGDPFAVALLADLGHCLGAALADLCAVLDPEMIVVGGGLSDAGDLILNPMRACLAEDVITADLVAPPEVVVAALGGAAGVIGAAELAERHS